MPGYSWNSPTKKPFDVDEWDRSKRKRRNKTQQNNKAVMEESMYVPGSDDEPEAMKVDPDDSEIEFLSSTVKASSSKSASKKNEPNVARLRTSAPSRDKATKSSATSASPFKSSKSIVSEPPRKKRCVEPTPSTSTSKQRVTPTARQPQSAASSSRSSLRSPSPLVKDEDSIEFIDPPSWEDPQTVAAVESDSSEDYGWDSHWDPLPESSKRVSEITASLAVTRINKPASEELAKEEEEFQREKEELKRAIRGDRRARLKDFILASGIAPRWMTLQHERQPTMSQLTPVSFGRRIQSSLAYELNLSSLKVSKTFKRSAGPIFQILQLPSNGIERKDFIVTSAALNGTIFQDSDDGLYTPSPYNKVGSLIHCKNDQVHVINGHYRRIQARDKEEHHIRMHGKTYSVNATALDPCRPDTFVTGGGDGDLVLWKVLEGENIDVDDMDDHISLSYGHVAEADEEFIPEGHDYARRVRPSLREDARIKHQGIIQDVRYDPEEKQRLAAGCSDGYIYVYPNISTSRTNGSKFKVSPGTQSAGSMAWGMGPSAHYLFSSTEGKNENDFHGYHYAFDIQSGLLAPDYKFKGIDGTEQGDCMSLDARGDRLAICTIARSGTHHLRLFDVRRKQNIATHTVELERFGLPDEDHNVHKVSFDPVDGLYIAVGRADNGIDVYDSRFMGEHRKGLLRRYQHDGSSRPQPDVPADALHKDNGIADFHWIVNPATNRMGIVSGGDDGCVRLWDINMHDGYNSTVLAQMDDAIAAISLGDTSQRQYPLIVGDYSGSVCVFDKIV